MPPAADAAGTLDPKEGASALFTDLLAQAMTRLWIGDTCGSLRLLDAAGRLDVSPVDRYSLGEALLRASRCARGWDLYDLHPSRPIDRLYGVERWDGQPCGLLVVVAEQGFGDAIQFLRFVPEIADRAQKIIIAVHDELLTTVSSSPLLAGFEIIGKSDAWRRRWAGDVRWERLMSLPARIDRFAVKPVEPYIRVGTISDQVRLPAARGVVTVGVAWRSTARRGFPSRSVPAHLMRSIAEAGPVRLVALHRTHDLKALPHGVQAVPINNFEDTAQVMVQCDYVVTADTVTAHLAPALGVPTLICLRNRPDWRWGAPMTPIDWYADAELLFQDESQDWGRVVATAARRISDDAARSFANTGKEDM